MRILSLLLIIVFSVSCAKTEDELVISAKREAMYWLTKGECSKAKSALDQVDYQSKDDEYIRLYADVYGCKAGYSQLDTVIENLSSLTATSADLFKSLAAFPSSQLETAADSTAYVNINKAIFELLRGGASAETSATTRISKFGATGAGDMHFQALFLILINMGKYLKYHGDAGAYGTKGGGGNWHCLIEYTDATARGYISTGSDSCDDPNRSSTSAETLTAAASYESKMCELIVLFNNLRDILSNISFSSNSSELGDTVNIGSVLDTVITTVEAGEPAVTKYKSILSQDSCETTATAESNNAEEAQRYFAIILENLHQ
jgi:hypothetical protein